MKSLTRSTFNVSNGRPLLLVLFCTMLCVLTRKLLAEHSGRQLSALPSFKIKLTSGRHFCCCCYTVFTTGCLVKNMYVEQQMFSFRWASCTLNSKLHRQGDFASTSAVLRPQACTTPGLIRSWRWNLGPNTGYTDTVN